MPGDAEVAWLAQHIEVMVHPSGPWRPARYFKHAQFSLSAGRHRPDLSRIRPVRSSLMSECGRCLLNTPQKEGKP
jgi:hypothetical protein